MSARGMSLKNLLLIHEFAFLFLVMVTGLLTGLSTYYWKQTAAESVRVNSLIYLTEQIHGDLFRQIQIVTRGRLMEDPQAESSYREYSRRINDHFNQLRRNSEEHDEDIAVQALQTSYRQIQQDMNQIYTNPYAIESRNRIKILDPRYFNFMVSDFDSQYKNIKNLLLNKQARLEKTSEQWIRLAPVLIPVSISIGVLLVLIARRILRNEFVKPMAVVMEGASVISRGDLEHRIPAKGVKEVADLAASINQMAGDLASSRDALIESEKQAALGSLVPVVAHNIRNPLASIRATVQVLDDGADRDEIRESKLTIIETIDRLGRWVNALVSYLHPLKPNFRTASASALVEGALTVLKPKLEEKQLHIRREDWDRDRELKVDPDLMEQALAGLLANAFDASPQAGTVTIRFAKSGDRFELHIRDTGPGLPFIPDAGNLEPGPSTKRYGTGLGIPIAFKICQAHGWDLKFINIDDGGTGVVISIPVSEAGERGP